jgi:uncharacterized RDD family membrane protein YckC
MSETPQTPDQPPALPAQPYASVPEAPPGSAPAAQWTPPPAPAGMYFDAQSGLMLPEGTQLASVGRRIGAYFLALPLAVGTLIIGYVIWGIVAWTRGTTPALQVLGMRCWRPEDGRVPGFWWMALREIVGRLCEGVLGAITGLVSFIMFLSSKDRKSLHDLIAGTVVLHDPNKTLG